MDLDFVDLSENLLGTGQSGLEVLFLRPKTFQRIIQAFRKVWKILIWLEDSSKGLRRFGVAMWLSWPSSSKPDNLKNAQRQGYKPI